MDIGLNHLTNRLKTDEKLLKEHPEHKDMLEKRLKETKKLIIQRAVNCADHARKGEQL